MENRRENHSASQSGIALVSAMVIMASCLLFISAVAFIFRGGWNVAIINKQYATAQEAASGAVDHASEVIRLINSDISFSASQMGVANLASATDAIYNCTGAETTISAKTADGRYSIQLEIKCIGQTPIPGGSGALVFPPPPAFASGGSMPSYYVFYHIKSTATLLDNSSKALVETVYRFAR